MKIKIKDKEYTTIKVPQYNKLKGMLEIIMTENPTKRIYHGIMDKGKVGILVCGTDKNQIKEYRNFYSIEDIHFYFNNYVKNLKERRIVGT